MKYLAAQLSLFFSVSCFFGLGQQRVQTVDQLLLTGLLVFTLKPKTTRSGVKIQVLLRFVF